MLNIILVYKCNIKLQTRPGEPNVLQGQVQLHLLAMARIWRPYETIASKPAGTSQTGSKKTERRKFGVVLGPLSIVHCKTYNVMIIFQ